MILVFDSFKEYCFVECQLFCRMVFNLGSSDVFHIFRVGLWALGRKITEVKYYSYYTISGVHPNSLIFNISISELRDGESKKVELKSLSFAMVKIVVKIR